MRFSIIIPTYNRRELLRRCLEGVTAQRYPGAYEVIVVDDASPDATAGMVAREFPGVCCVRQTRNGGQIAARNRAIRTATGELLVFTDDDCVPPPHWLAAHRSHYDDPRVAAVGGPLVSPRPSFYDKFYACHHRDEYERVVRTEHLAGWERLVTGNMSVRRQMLDRIGLFDERFISGSDADLARRISRAGFVFVVDPHADVEHLKTYSFTSFLRERFRKASGSILTDVKEGTVQARRFAPMVNPAVVWRDWRNFRAMYGAGPAASIPFWMLALVTRWVEVAGRAYYYWTAGRRFRRPMAHLPPIPGGG